MTHPQPRPYPVRLTAPHPLAPATGHLIAISPGRTPLVHIRLDGGELAGVTLPVVDTCCEVVEQESEES